MRLNQTKAELKSARSEEQESQNQVKIIQSSLENLEKRIPETEKLLADLKKQSENDQLKLSNIQNSHETIQLKVRAIEASVKATEAELEKLKANKIIVSEHALLRYFERIFNLDLEEVKESILSEDVLANIHELGGTCKYPITSPQGDNMTLVVKDYIVVTVEN